MRVIISGSRTISEMAVLEAAIAASGFSITMVIHGHHWEGVDALADKWAFDHGIIPERYPAKWKLQGSQAGPIRNAYMAFKTNAEACIVVWDGKSTGSLDMAKNAEEAGLKRFVYRVSKATGVYMPLLVCQACLGPLVPILYGMPMSQKGEESPFEKAKRGELIIGGCCVSGDDPQYGCAKCHKERKSPMQLRIEDVQQLKKLRDDGRLD